MNKIEEMIKQLCPNGVEWKKLGEIAKNLDSKRKPITSSKRTTGEYPYYGASGIVDYIDNYIFDGDYLLISEDGANLVARNTPIAFSINGKTWVNNHAHVLFIENYFCRKFIEVYLNSISLEPYISGGAQPKLNQENLNKIQIPHPPLPIQTEIVRILDKFVEQQEQIERLIELRKKQYEYYREEMLKPKEGEDTIPLSDIAEIGTGSSNTNEELENGKYPFFVRSQEVRSKDEYEFDEEAVITSGDGVGVGKIFHYVNGKYALHQRAYRIHITDSNYNPKFFFYYMKNTFLDYISRTEVKSSVQSIRRSMLNKYPVPCYSIEKQKEIIDIFDSFESSIAALTSALEASKRRYEYYRDEMMRF